MARDCAIPTVEEVKIAADIMVAIMLRRPYICGRSVITRARCILAEGAARSMILLGSSWRAFPSSSSEIESRFSSRTSLCDRLLEIQVISILDRTFVHRIGRSWS